MPTRHPHHNVSFVVLISILLAVMGCDRDLATEGPPHPRSYAEDYSGAWATEWMDLMHDGVFREAMSPPVASRVYAYGGITLYESLIEAMPYLHPLSGQLPGLAEEELPYGQYGQKYDWPSVVAGAMATMSKSLFVEAQTHHLIDALRDAQLAARRARGIPLHVTSRSAIHGSERAQRLVEWAKEDGYAQVHEHTFVPPVGPHAWEPTGLAAALLPFWSTLRPFALKQADSCAPPPPVEYSEAPHSSFYRQAMIVYEATKDLSGDEAEIAFFWADNPGESATPAGHWLSIASQIITRFDMNLEEAAEIYALLTIAMADAFISCWQVKYDTYLLRPVTYIQRHIDPSWEPVLKTPPFPEYTSGHSNASGAAAHILTHLLGRISFTDRTFEEHGVVRHFKSFEDAAQEAAISRLYGGIHYPMGIDEGVPQGICVGENVLERITTRR